MSLKDVKVSENLVNSPELTGTLNPQGDPMTFKIEFSCDNAAFDSGQLGPEIARILRREADAFQDASKPEIGRNTVQDINGNRVGYAILSP